MTQDRVRIYSPQGFPRAEFRANVSRSWVIGNEGRAAFTLSNLDTTNVDESVINAGNWLYVQNDSLPDWVGIIDFPREWGFYAVTVHAYTPERLFQLRRGPIQRTFTGSAGALFEQLIMLINQAGRTALVPGNIWKNDDSHDQDLNPVKLNTILRDLYLSSGEEYTWRADTDDRGRLIVYGDWVQRLGTNTKLLLQQGKGGGNIEATAQPLIETEPVENDMLGYGPGLTWATKLTSQQVDEDSINAYGVRQGTREFRKVTAQVVMDKKTYNWLQVTKKPGRVYDVVALDPTGTLVFPWLRLGNTSNLKMQTVGFLNGQIGTDTTVRILGMGFDPVSGNRVPLILKEIS